MKPPTHSAETSPFTRRELARAARSTVGAVRRAEERGELTPKRDARTGVVRFERAEGLAWASRRTPRAPVVAQAAFELLRDGANARDLVLRLGVTPARARALVAEYAADDPWIIPAAEVRALERMGYRSARDVVAGLVHLRAERRAGGLRPVPPHLVHGARGPGEKPSPPQVGHCAELSSPARPSAAPSPSGASRAASTARPARVEASGRPVHHARDIARKYQAG